MQIFINLIISGHQIKFGEKPASLFICSICSIDADPSRGMLRSQAVCSIRVIRSARSGADIGSGQGTEAERKARLAFVALPSIVWAFLLTRHQHESSLVQRSFTAGLAVALAAPISTGETQKAGGNNNLRLCSKRQSNHRSWVSQKEILPLVAIDDDRHSQEKRRLRRRRTTRDSRSTPRHVQTRDRRCR